MAAFVAMAACAATFAQAPPAARFVVVLDAAHGGDDAGAHLGSEAEKAYTLAFSVRLRSLLMARGFSVVMTRESDDAVDPDHRAEIANHANAQACLSLHAAESGSGVHLFVSSLAPVQDAHFLAWKTAQAAWIMRSLSLAGVVNSALSHATVPVTLGRTCTSWDRQHDLSRRGHRNRAGSIIRCAGDLPASTIRTTRRAWRTHSRRRWWSGDRRRPREASSDPSPPDRPLHRSARGLRHHGRAALEPIAPLSRSPAAWSGFGADSGAPGGCRRAGHSDGGQRCRQHRAATDPHAALTAESRGSRARHPGQVARSLCGSRLQRIPCPAAQAQSRRSFLFRLRMAKEARRPTVPSLRWST